MCGIGGILRVWSPEQRELALRTPHAQSIPEAWLDILDDAVKHRGPDGQGRFRDRTIRADGSVVDVAFVHRRLSIIDHVGGHQPMVWTRTTGILPMAEVERYSAHVASNHGQDARGTDEDRIAIVFNGCIYNHRELRAELQKAGHVFTTDHSDTEVLVHGWREWGPDLYDRLDGMWSWTIWESARGRLIFSRDPAGEKPLHLSPSKDRESGVVVLASSPAALWRLRALIGDKIDPPSLGLHGRLMWGYDAPAAGQSIQPVSPCCIAVFDEDSGVFHQDYLYGPTPWRWDLESRAKGKALTTDSIDELLSKSVVMRLQADVEVAGFLSGGIDSALVTAYAKQALGAFRTFTVRMPDRRYDESAAAELTARLLGTDHATIDCDPSPAEDLQRLITQLGEPLGDSSLLPTHWVCRAIANTGLHVALGGDGGDELFGGYERYRAAGWLRRYSSTLARLPSGWLGSNHPKSFSSRLARLVRAARSGGYPDLLRIFSVEQTERLLSPGNSESKRSDSAMDDTPGWTSTRDPRLYDFEHYLPFDLCAKVDTAAMSVALETRAPMLSRDLTAITLGNPLTAVMPHGQRKGLLRQVARKYLPTEIVDRPKMGFAIPIGEWFRSDYGGLRTMLLDHLNSTEPFGPPSLGIDLNMAFIRQMLDEHLGTGPSGLIKRDHSQRLYMLLVLSIWAKWLGGLNQGR